MFEKLLASIGIGSATVETTLEKNTYQPGETIQGKVKVTGGSVAQQIDKIYFYIVARYQIDTTIPNEIISETLISSELFEIAANEIKFFDLQVVVPFNTPIVVDNKHFVHCHTGLEIARSIDPKDVDSLNIAPHPLQQLALDAMKKAGFDFYYVACSNLAPARDHHHSPLVQIFDFHPNKEAAFYSTIQEAQAHLHFESPERLQILLELDKRESGIVGFFNNLLGDNEDHSKITVTTADTAETIAPQILEHIQAFLKRKEESNNQKIDEK